MAFGEYSTGLFILASTLNEKFVEMELWLWSDAKRSYEAPRQTPWSHCRDMGRQTMQVISNGASSVQETRGRADGALMPWSAEKVTLGYV